MTAEFNVWLLIVGLVVGAGLVWLVVMDSRRHESEVDDIELPREAAWLSEVMSDDGFEVSSEVAERILLLHRAYLSAAPPDGVTEGDEDGDVGVERVGNVSDLPSSPGPRALTDEDMPLEPGDPADRVRRSG